MKKSVRVAIATACFSVLMLSGQSEAGVGVYVRIGPPRARVVKVVRPARPFRSAVWVNGHYVYRHGHYVWVKGYWLKRKPGYVYVQPHWKHTHRGYVFMPGHWIRK